MFDVRDPKYWDAAELDKELRRVFVAATEEALRLQMPQDDLALLVNHHASAAIAAIEASQVEEDSPSAILPIEPQQGAFLWKLVRREVTLDSPHREA